MGQKATTFKVKAIRTIKYRFTCEHCMRPSGWMSFTFQSEEQAVADGWNARLSAQEEKTLNDKATLDVEEKLSYAMRAAQKRKYPFSDLCPYCSKHQSWGNNALYGYLLSVPVCVCVLTAAFLWMFSLLDNDFALWAIIIATAGSLVATLAYVVFRTKQTAKTAKRHLPEIDWNEQ